MKVQMLADILHVTPVAIVTAAWLELGLRKNAESNLSTKEAVRLRELLLKTKNIAPSKSKELSGTDGAGKPQKSIADICEKHRILAPPPLPTVPPPKLPANWKNLLTPTARKHLDLPSKRVRVRLRPRVHALIFWPAAYIEGNEFYFLGETVPVNLRNISRPYNFLMQEVAGKPRPFILRRYWGTESSEYSYLYTKIGICGLLDQPPSAWKPCEELRMPSHPKPPPPPTTKRNMRGK